MDSEESSNKRSHTKKARTSRFPSLSPFERLVAWLLLLLVVASGTTMAFKANNGTFIEVPRSGGRHVEGVVGTPRFINPLLAISDSDQDLTSLVYAGLLTRNKEGLLTPLLAESYTISEDGTVYTFTLRQNLFFHDTTPLTSEDVIYTIEQAANPSIRSPLFANWDGVATEALDKRTIQFTLPEPYAPFIENATIGIIPKHLWGSLSPEEFTLSRLNTEPIGAGPYIVSDILRDKSLITTSYELAAFEHYALGVPHITTMVFKLYRNSKDALQAFAEDEVDAVHSVSPAHIEDMLRANTIPNIEILRAPYLRIFGIFFNHNRQPIFLRDEVREALEEATPKKAVVGEILQGYGTSLDAPLPDYLYKSSSKEEEVEENEDETEESGVGTAINHVERARTILEKRGWERDEDSGTYVLEQEDETLRLSVSLSTVNTPELVQAAERIVESWREMGAEVELNIFDPADITQSVIRPRRYEALLFGEVLGYEVDLYAFWHSSQRNDPGLNIAQFADIEADALLEKARVEQDADVRAELFGDFVERVQTEHAAIFVYSPDFIYLVRDRVQSMSVHPVAEPADRFDNVHEWYIETDHVWPFVPNILDKR